MFVQALNRRGAAATLAIYMRNTWPAVTITPRLDPDTKQQQRLRSRRSGVPLSEHVREANREKPVQATEESYSPMPLWWPCAN